MNDRGMKKWAPYKSLNEQEYFMHQMRNEKAKIEKPILTPDLEEEINNILVNATEDTLIEFTYYQKGYLFKVEQYIKEIDMVNRIIKGTEENIKIDDITFLKVLS